MKSLKRMSAFVLIAVLVLTACGGSGNTLEGSYRSENDPGFVMTFTADAFTLEMPFADMEMPELDGSLIIRGGYTHNSSNRTITFDLDEAALENDIRAAIDAYLLQDPEVQELMSDPETAEFAEAMFAGVIDGMISAMMDEVTAEIDGIVMSHERDFSKLYDEDGAWIRQ